MFGNAVYICVCCDHSHSRLQMQHVLFCFVCLHPDRLDLLMELKAAGYRMFLKNTSEEDESENSDMEDSTGTTPTAAQQMVRLLYSLSGMAGVCPVPLVHACRLIVPCASRPNCPVGTITSCRPSCGI